MTKKSRWTILSASTILTLAVGLIYVAHLRYFGLKLDGKVKTIEVLTLAVNLMIAWALQNFLVSRATDTRAEKDFLIEIVKEAQARTKECSDKFYACSSLRQISESDFHFLKESCRNLSNALEQIESTLAKSEAKHLGPECEALKSAYYQYKAVVTDISPNGTYPPEATGQHAEAHRRMSGKLWDIILEINRC